MRKQRSEHTLLWLIRAEDSSSWEAERREACCCLQNRRGFFSSVIKLLVWYGIAVAVAILLTRLQ